jgi:hypothetical protein
MKQQQEQQQQLGSAEQYETTKTRIALTVLLCEHFYCYLVNQTGAC